MTGERIGELRLVSRAGEVPLAGYRYDPAGNLARIVNSSGKTLRFSYDWEGC